jgi:hypothetical protein
MEVGGLAVGIIALAGFFNNAVDCFEYVQLGRNFGTNFQTSILFEHTRSLQEATIQKEDIAKAERVLGQILELFAAAEEISTKYKRSAKPDDSNLTALDVHAEMDPLGISLYEQMRKLCIKRQNRTTLRQKVKWALYEEKHFKRLIEDIIDLVSDLPELFSTVKQEQLKLCEIEVSEIGLEPLSGLIEIVKTQDKDLEAAISAAMRSTVGESRTWRKQLS